MPAAGAGELLAGLGMRSGEGFRKWTPEQAEEVRARLRNFLAEQTRKQRAEKQ